MNLHNPQLPLLKVNDQLNIRYSLLHTQKKSKIQAEDPGNRFSFCGTVDPGNLKHNQQQHILY